MQRKWIVLVFITLVTAQRVRAVAAECGNGLLEDSETCTACAVDCKVESCTPTLPTRSVSLTLTAPPERSVNGATLLLAYRSRLVSLPGSDADGSVRSRVSDTPSNSIVAVNDRDYALRIVLARQAGTLAEKVATIAFDSCQGMPPPRAADFACVVEGCANTFGKVDDCACTVAMQP